MTPAAERCYDRPAFGEFGIESVTACEDFQRHRFFLGAIFLASLRDTAARGVRRKRRILSHGGMTFDRFLADLKAAGGRRRRVAAGDRGSLALSRLRPGHRQPRSRPARVRAGVHRVRRPHGGAATGCSRAQARIKTYAAAFARAEKEYGVPPAVIAAFWGLESDFGANMGNLPTLPLAGVAGL